MEIKRTSAFYMANIGSEVSRAFSFRRKGDFNEVKNAIDRAFGIINTLQQMKEMESRKFEIDILKDLLISISNNTQEFKDEKNLQMYFYPFAMRMMI